MYARGLSTRDIEAAFRDATGASLLSRTAVSQVTERLWQEYEAFAGRDLSEFAVAYFFVDGVAERLHAGLPREAVLCAWGMTEDGQKVSPTGAGHEGGDREWTAFFKDQTPRPGGTPCWPLPTARPGRSGRRDVLPGPRASRAWRTGCGTAEQGPRDAVAGDRDPSPRVLCHRHLQPLLQRMQIRPSLIRRARHVISAAYGRVEVLRQIGVHDVSSPDP